GERGGASGRAAAGRGDGGPDRVRRRPAGAEGVVADGGGRARPARGSGAHAQGVARRGPGAGRGARDRGRVAARRAGARARGRVLRAGGARDTPPPSGGWDAITTVSYDGGGGDRIVEATARRHGGVTYVALLDGDRAARSRRGPQLERALATLRPEGMRQESF